VLLTFLAEVLSAGLTAAAASGVLEHARFAY
jgi:hypothetical protein